MSEPERCVHSWHRGGKEPCPEHSGGYRAPFTAIPVCTDCAGTHELFDCRSADHPADPATGGDR